MRIGLLALAALVVAAPLAAHADTYNVSYYYPDLSTVFEDHGTATTGNFYGDIQYTLTPTNLTLTSTEGFNNSYTVAAFNGIVLRDLGGSNPITGATVDAASIDPSAVMISVTGGNVYLNFSGSAFNTDIVEIFDFTTSGTTSPSATPEPSSLVLLGTGAFALAGAARRKFLKA